MDSKVSENELNLMLCEQRRQGVSQRLRDEMQAAYPRRLNRITWWHGVVVVCLALALIAAVVALLSSPNGRDMAANGDRTMALSTINHIISQL